MTIASAEVPTTPEAPKPSTTLAGALIRARKSAQATVYKAGRNQDQKYRYAGHEQVIVASRDALLDHGLSLEQRSVEFAGELVYETRQGRRPVWRWVGLFRLVHESGETAEYRYEATTQANDKAAFVASTALDRVAHMRVLELAGTDDEDPEHDSHDDRARRDYQGPPAADAAAHGRREDRTADPPASNVRRLPEPQGRRLSPEAISVVELFGPKLTRLQTQPELRGWWAEVVRGRFDRPVMEALWRMFAQHARNLGFDPLQIVPPKGGR